MNIDSEERKIIVKNWFENLRNSICKEFEDIEYKKSKKKLYFKKQIGKLVDPLKEEAYFL